MFFQVVGLHFEPDVLLKLSGRVAAAVVVATNIVGKNLKTQFPDLVSRKLVFRSNYNYYLRTKLNF